MSRGLRKKWKKGDRFLIKHKDRALAVVDKTAGILTVPTPSGRGENLRDHLRQALGGRRLFVVHRIDRVVSGLLVFARHHEAFERLKSQFAAHSAHRVYCAAVHGHLAEESGTFDTPLSFNETTLTMYGSRRGKTAVTHWRVKRRLANTTLVEVQLETGLRNQIRVHFAEAGHPLVGEKKYRHPGRRTAKAIQGAQRIFLHAAELGFEHPVTRRHMRFESPLPRDLERLLRQLEGADTPSPAAE